MIITFSRGSTRGQQHPEKKKVLLDSTLVKTFLEFIINFKTEIGLLEANKL